MHTLGKKSCLRGSHQEVDRDSRDGILLHTGDVSEIDDYDDGGCGLPFHTRLDLGPHLFY
jgi:hypothetical protein